MTDVVLTGMSGVELCRRLREHDPRLRAVFLSGYTRELAAIDDAGLRRRLVPLRRGPGATLIDPDGRTLVDFASNDYLGLAADPRPAAAAAAFLQLEGVGAGAARLITGNHPLHEALEAALAALKGAERALLFPSGYAANVGAHPALAGAGDEVYSEALNHASLIDG